MAYNRIIKVQDNNAYLDKDIYLTRGDKGIITYFSIEGFDYDFDKGVASYSQITLEKPNGSQNKLEKLALDNNKVCFAIPDEDIDGIDEIGNYNLQITLFDDDKTSISLPIIYNQLHVSDNLNTNNTSSSEINQASINKGHVIIGNEEEIFDENKGYNATTWGNNDSITTGKMNKIEKSIRYLFDNIIQDRLVVNDTITLLEERFQSVSIDNDLTINLPSITYHATFTLYVKCSQNCTLYFISNSETQKMNIKKGNHMITLSHIGDWIVSKGITQYDHDEFDINKIFTKLKTTDKTIIGGINELYDGLNTINTTKEFTDLKTTNKKIIGSINELKNIIDEMDALWESDM